MAILELRAQSECKYDVLSLGEVMLRLDPGDERIHTTRTFRVWEGGGEYNVARGLKRAFGKRAAVVTAIVDNPVGRLLEDLMLQGGVSLEYVKWVPFDGIGRKTRVGLNFTERGFGIRGAVGCSDRANSAASQLKEGDIDWDRIFGRDGVRWFHTGGIFAALSTTTPQVIIEAVTAAKTHGTIVSYDLNYRNSLWRDVGGQELLAARPDELQEDDRDRGEGVPELQGGREDAPARQDRDAQ
jgi:2-dehydro-3-deoxygluconokinase